MKKGRTAKGNEIAPAKMPLMRIRSVEIVFEDEMSTCTDTAILDRSIELIVSDSSDDSTKCVDDLEQLHVEKDDDDSVTLNAEADLSDDNSISTKDHGENRTGNMSQHDHNSEDTQEQIACLTLNDENTLNISEIVDSGHYTEDACSSHVELPKTYDDALLSQSFDVVNVDESTVNVADACESPEVNVDLKRKLYEYVDSNSDDSDSTAVCEEQTQQQASSYDVTDLEDQSYDASDLQYDSFVDMGKF